MYTREIFNDSITAFLVFGIVRFILPNYILGKKWTWTQLFVTSLFYAIALVMRKKIIKQLNKNTDKEFHRLGNVKSSNVLKFANKNL